MTTPALTMILVPGAMHGSWTWDRVTPLLEAAGIHTIVVDLPGMGPNPGIASTAVTMPGWAEFIADLAQEAAGPVILAGHSRGGLVIGEAAERLPERIAGLIYVTAMIALPGQTGWEAGRDRAVQPGEIPAAAPFTPERAKAIFYNRCTPADADWAVSRLELEPPAPLATAAGVTWERWGKVPRGYIECLQDRTLSLARQRRFQAGAPCDPVVQLDTDHSPFLSMPGPLVQAMIGIARSFSPLIVAPGLTRG